MGTGCHIQAFSLELASKNKKTTLPICRKCKSEMLKTCYGLHCPECGRIVDISQKRRRR